MTKLYSYKSLKDVPLNKIYSKYAIEGLDILQFRQRIYSGSMEMDLALTKPPLINKDSFINNPYVINLYDKLKKITPNYVTKQSFILKMSNGFAPSEAIKKRNTRKATGKKVAKIPKTLSVAEIIANLKKQEAKEKKEEIKKLKKPKPFSVKENKYVENLDVLNSAFNMVKSNK